MGKLHAETSEGMKFPSAYEELFLTPTTNSQDTTSLSDMMQFVAHGLPNTLDDYYRRIFDAFDEPHRPMVG